MVRSIHGLQEVRQITGDLHARLGEYEDSAEVFETLYNRNPENASYIENYVRAHGHCEYHQACYDSFVQHSPVILASLKIRLDAWASSWTLRKANFFDAV